MSILSDDELRRTLAALEEHGSQNATARALGIARSTLQSRLSTATERGLGSHFVSSSAIPQGLAVKGTTTLYGPNGEVKGQWIKTRADVEETIEAIKSAFEEWETRPPVLKLTREDLNQLHLQTLYPIADLHFGMYAWKEETGYDYDTLIASKTLLNAFIELSGRTPASDTGIILNVGDFFHSDNDENRTRRSGNKLDVDTRYARVLREGVQLFIQVIELAKEKHKNVYVKNIPGNHDPYGTLALTTALSAYYSKDERVIVDVEASPIWTYDFGKVLLAAAHGDMVKPEELPATVASRFGEEWGNATWRYGYLGHTHRREVFEKGGMEIEVLRTLAPKDAWGTAKGFSSRRSIKSITFDHQKGEVHSETVNVK